MSYTSSFGHFQGGLWNYRENTLLCSDFSRAVENFRAVLVAFMTRVRTPVAEERHIQVKMHTLCLYMARLDKFKTGMKIWPKGE